MDPYTHAVLAQQMLPLVQPKNEDAYLWGAVAPDVRYIARMRRDVTHVPDSEIARWFSIYPGCESFVTGYRVHCMIDQIDPLAVVSRAFPLSLLGRVMGKQLNRQQMTVVIGLYYMQAFPQGLQLHGEHNSILEGLGITPSQSTAFAGALAKYFSAPSVDASVQVSAELGIIENTRIEKYMQAYRKISRHRILFSILMASVRNARLGQLAATMFRELPKTL